MITYYFVAYDKLKRSDEDRNTEQHTFINRDHATETGEEEQPVNST